MTAFDDVLTYVEEELGFATSHYDSSYLDRRVSSRMRRTDVNEHEEYLDLLRDDVDERERLLDALSVNVTSFFRNPGVWEELRGVLDALAEDGSMKLWSAACSDGREPYSMAMLALDQGLSPRDFEVVATDIDEEVLEVAREGVYHSTRTTDIDEQLGPIDDYERFVEQEEDRFVVADQVRDRVEFEQHDLINDAPKQDVDLVSCRNLFIYINAEHKLPMLRTITRSLRIGGYLVIGKTETLPEELKAEYQAVDKRLRIYKKCE